MSSSQRKKRLGLVLGLMILFLLGLLWHAGLILQGARGIRGAAGRMGAETPTMPPGPVAVTKKIPAPASGEADAAEGTPAGIQKKLSPKSEPVPTPPPPGSEPIGGGKEKTQEPQAPPPALLASPAPPVSEGMPEKPIEAKPAENLAPGAPAAPVSAKKQPESTMAVARMETRGASLYPFSILLCSHQALANARAMQPDFEQRGLAAYIVHSDLGKKGVWWRTLFGGFKSYEEALQAIKDLRIDHGVPIKTPFANLLGNYPSEKQAAEAAAPFAAKGLFPYVAKGTGNAARLLVGAFPTQAAAEQHQRELVGMGINAPAIRR